MYSRYGLSAISCCRDLNAYKEASVRFGVPSVAQSFDALCQLANIHLVEEASMYGLVRESLVGHVPEADLVAHLATHQHYSRSWIEQLGLKTEPKPA